MELRERIPLLIGQEEESAAEELIEDYEEGDLEEFFDKYPELLGGYDDAQTFLEEVEDGIVCLGTILTWYLMERGVLMLINWDGEEEENLLADYVNYRLESMGADFTVETESFYRWAEAVSCPAEDGNLVWELFQAVDGQLRKHGFCLIGFDTQCEPDNIYVGVFPQAEAALLLREEITDVFVACAEDL